MSNNSPLAIDITNKRPTRSRSIIIDPVVTCSVSRLHAHSLLRKWNGPHEDRSGVLLSGYLVASEHPTMNMLIPLKKLPFWSSSLGSAGFRPSLLGARNVLYVSVYGFTGTSCNHLRISTRLRHIQKQAVSTVMSFFFFLSFSFLFLTSAV